MTPVIAVRDVSKRFVIQHERNRSFQDVLVNLFRNRRTREEFYAVRDVSFDVAPGEGFGIIGRNGSGKSTMLKMLARIFPPTAGTIDVRGKVSALLELGAGFHPDLSGRDNVYLNGSLLGINRREMHRRFDTIVGFAEMEKFIDSPVRHYSSGMYVRLAFAIAINVDAQVLIADEILAVGDQGFQARCLHIINDLKTKGVTLLLVSHSLDSVQLLCDRALWLDRGRVRAIGRTPDVLGPYAASFVPPPPPAAPPLATFEEVHLFDATGRERTAFAPREALKLVARYRSAGAASFGCRVEIHRLGGPLGLHLVHAADTRRAGLCLDGRATWGTLDLGYDDLALGPGEYVARVIPTGCEEIASPDSAGAAEIRFIIQGGTEDDGNLVLLPHRWLGPNIRRSPALVSDGRRD